MFRLIVSWWTQVTIAVLNERLFICLFVKKDIHMTFCINKDLPFPNLLIILTLYKPILQFINMSYMKWYVLSNFWSGLLYSFGTFQTRVVSLSWGMMSPIPRVSNLLGACLLSSRCALIVLYKEHSLLYRQHTCLFLPVACHTTLTLWS